MRERWKFLGRVAGGKFYMWERYYPSEPFPTQCLQLVTDFWRRA